MAALASVTMLDVCLQILVTRPISKFLVIFQLSISTMSLILIEIEQPVSLDLIKAHNVSHLN